jgi:hypothetical protein
MSTGNCIPAKEGGAHEVDVNSMKSGVRGGERSEWGEGVVIDLCSLTLEAGTCPPSNVGIHHWPDVVGSYESLCRSDSSVG